MKNHISLVEKNYEYMPRSSKTEEAGPTRGRISLSLDLKLLQRIAEMSEDPDSPFYGNKSRLVDYYLKRSLPPKGDMSVAR